MPLGNPAGYLNPAYMQQMQQQRGQMQPMQRPTPWNMQNMANAGRAIGGFGSMPNNFNMGQFQQQFNQPMQGQMSPQPSAPPPPPPAQALMNPNMRQQTRMDFLASQGRAPQNNFAQSQNPYGQMNPNQQQRVDYLQSQGRDPNANFARAPRKELPRAMRPAKPIGIMSRPPTMA